MEAGTDNLVETLSRLSLFADLPYPQVEALAHTFTEEVFAEGQRVIREGMTGSGSLMGSGIEPFQISILTDELPTADVTATTMLRCLTIPDNELKAFMLRQPNVMYRMLQVEARRLRAANAWRG